jgi:hypothetical protein
MKKLILLIVLGLSVLTSYSQKWYQIGFKLSSKVPLNRTYSYQDYASSVRSLQFGGYFRAGQYVYGEIGIGYEYLKGYFVQQDPLGLLFEDLVETRYLVIPIKVVGDVTFGKHYSFLPYAGILYQPLLQVTENTLGYSKKNIENHWTLLTTGFDFRLKFITLGVDYRLSFQKFFTDRDGKLPQFIGFNVGVQF